MATTYTFTNVVNTGNANFNQLLGINNSGTIEDTLAAAFRANPTRATRLA